MSVTELSTVEASVTWNVNVLSAPTGRVAVSVQVTVWPSPSSRRPLTKVRPLSRTSVTWRSPVWSDGPALWTVTE